MLGDCKTGLLVKQTSQARWPSKKMTTEQQVGQNIAHSNISKIRRLQS